MWKRTKLIKKEAKIGPFQKTLSKVAPTLKFLQQRFFELARVHKRDEQCDQIGRSLQVLGNKLSHKSCPKNLVTFWAISKNITIMYKKCVLHLGQFSGEIRQLLIPSSGHTDDELLFVSLIKFLDQFFDAPLKSALAFGCSVWPDGYIICKDLAIFYN